MPLLRSSSPMPAARWSIAIIPVGSNWAVSESETAIPAAALSFPARSSTWRRPRTVVSISSIPAHCESRPTPPMAHCGRSGANRRPRSKVFLGAATRPTSPCSPTGELSPRKRTFASQGFCAGRDLRRGRCRSRELDSRGPVDGQGLADHEFTAVDVAADSRGRMLVLDRNAGRVRIFEGKGRTGIRN